jgi:hypothetical protein
MVTRSLSSSSKPAVRKVLVGWSVDGYWCPTRRIRDHWIAKRGIGKAWLVGMTNGDLRPSDEPDGWPEFSITLDFYVSSDDPAVAERERQRVWEALPDVILEATDG